MKKKLYLFISGIRGVTAKGSKGCVKRILPPSAAKYYFDRHVVLTISQSEIVKTTCLSKHNLARSAPKGLFTQPQTISIDNDLLYNCKNLSYRGILIFALCAICFFSVSAQEGRLPSKPAYLEFSAGLNYLFLRDAGVSPLLFSGPLFFTQGSWHKETGKTQWRADFGYSIGEIEKARAFIVDSDINAFFHGLSAFRSFKQSANGRLNLLGGLHYHGFSNYRVTPAFRNNASVVESLNTIFAGAKADYSLTKTFRPRKFLFFRRKGGERDFKFSTQFNVPVLHASWRPDFAYLDDFTGGDNTVGRDNIIRVGGYRLMWRSEFQVFMRNGNAWKLSYHWEAQRSPGDLNRLETAQHIAAFSLLMRLN